MTRTDLIKKSVSLLLAAVLLFAVPVSASGKDGVGMNLLDMSSYTFAGDPVDGSIFYESSLTVINIWQRWCGPCWAELPAFLELYEYYSATPEADVDLWGALYYGSDPSLIAQAIEYVEEYGYNWNHMVLCSELEAVASSGYTGENYPIPQTLIVDRYGNVRCQVYGSITEPEELFGLVRRWLEQLEGEYAAEAGDVDGSGAADSLDALLLMRHLLSLITLDRAQLLKADFDGNGEVDSVDALAIMRLSMGLTGK